MKMPHPTLATLRRAGLAAGLYLAYLLIVLPRVDPGSRAFLAAWPVAGGLPVLYITHRRAPAVDASSPDRSTRR